MTTKAADQRLAEAMDSETSNPPGEVKPKIKVKTETKAENLKPKSNKQPEQRRSEAEAELKALKAELEALKAAAKAREAEEEAIIDGALLATANQAHGLVVQLLDRLVVAQNPWPQIEHQDDRHRALNVSLVTFVKWLSPAVDLNPGVAYGVGMAMFVLSNRREDEKPKAPKQVAQNPSPVETVAADRIVDMSPSDSDPNVYVDGGETPFDQVITTKSTSPLSSGNGLV
jgi:hypothetical protein